MEMDLHTALELTPSVRSPPFFMSTRRRRALVLLYSGLSSIDVRQLEIDLFLLRSPLFPWDAKLAETKPPSFSPPAG